MISPKLDKTLFFIISGPSGAGEDSVIEGLEKKIKLKRVVTTVTRSKRPGEKEGYPYHFVTVPEFKKMIAENKFVEWAKVYGDYRGSTKKEINKIIKKKILALWKIDFQGVKIVKKKIPGVVSVFIYPPSQKVLERRLMKRGQDSPEVIEKRRSFTKKWLGQKKIYDYVVVNRENKLDATINEVLCILKRQIQKNKAGS
jgi:guanylate kinase